jgi:hypothetical protein
VTFIQDENCTIPAHITHLEADDPGLARELARRWKLRQAVNQMHMARIQRIVQLPRFSGDIQDHRRIGSNALDPSVAPGAGDDGAQHWDEPTIYHVPADGRECNDSDIEDDVCEQAEALYLWEEGLRA